MFRPLKQIEITTEKSETYLKRLPRGGFRGKHLVNKIDSAAISNFLQKSGSQSNFNLIFSTIYLLLKFCAKRIMFCEVQLKLNIVH
jgi:hypothetical protein